MRISISIRNNQQIGNVAVEMLKRGRRNNEINEEEVSHCQFEDNTRCGGMLFLNRTHRPHLLHYRSYNRKKNNTQQECLMVFLSRTQTQTRLFCVHIVCVLVSEGRRHVVRCSALPSRHKLTPTASSTHINRKSQITPAF